MTESDAQTVGCPKETLEKLLQLEAAHAAMLIQFKKKMQRKVKSKDLADFVFSFLEQCRPDLAGKNVDKAFQLLSLHTDTFNTHILHCAATALNNTQALELVAKYDKKKNGFLHDTTVEDFKQIVQHRVAPQTFTSGSIVQLKLTGKWPERTLKDVEYLVNNIFGVKARVFLKPTYKDGCTEITWYAPHCDWMELSDIAHANSSVAYVQDVERIGLMTVQSHSPPSDYMHFIYPSLEGISNNFKPAPVSATKGASSVDDNSQLLESRRTTNVAGMKDSRKRLSLPIHGWHTCYGESIDSAQLTRQHSLEQVYLSQLDLTRSSSNISLSSSTQNVALSEVDGAAMFSIPHDLLPSFENQERQSSKRDSVLSNVSSSSVSSIFSLTSSLLSPPHT